DVNMEIAPSPLPPFPRDLLMARYDQIPARPRGQVARDGGFQIQAGLHPSILTRLSRNTVHFSIGLGIPTWLAYRHLGILPTLARETRCEKRQIGRASCRERV